MPQTQSRVQERAGRGRYLVINLRAGVGDGLVVAMMSGGSHRHSHNLLFVPPKSTKSLVTSPPRGWASRATSAMDVRPLRSQQKGQKTNACEPKHL